jgi:hypothetical protein
MTESQKEGVKQTARELHQARRISLEMAVWEMKNAGYSREETAESLELNKPSKDESINIMRGIKRSR